MDIPLVHPSTYATSNTIWPTPSSLSTLSYDNPFLPGERVIPSGRPGGYAEIHSQQLQWLKALSNSMERNQGSGQVPVPVPGSGQQGLDGTADIQMTQQQQYAGMDIAPALNFRYGLSRTAGVSTQTQSTGNQGRGEFGMQAQREIRDEKEPEANFDTLEYPTANIPTGARYDQLLEAKLGPGTSPVVPYNQPTPNQDQTAAATTSWSNNNFPPTPIQFPSNWYNPTPNNNLYPTSGRSISTSTSENTSPIPPLTTSYHVHDGVLGQSPAVIPQQYHPQGPMYFPYGPSSHPAHSTQEHGQPSADRQAASSRSAQPIYWSGYGDDSNPAGPSRQSHPGYPGWDTRAQAQQYPSPASGTGSTGLGWLNAPAQSNQISPVQHQSNYPYSTHYQSFPSHQHGPPRPEPAPLQQPPFLTQPEFANKPQPTSTTLTSSYQLQSQSQPFYPAQSAAHNLPRSDVLPVSANTKVPGQSSDAPAIGQRKRRKTQSDEGRSGQLRASISGTTIPGLVPDGSSGSSSTTAQYPHLDGSGQSGSLGRARTVSEGKIRAISSQRDQVREGEEEGERKVVIACYHCRAKKLKCDGARPRCHHCSRRGEEGCSYDSQLRRRGPGKKTKEKMQHEAAVQAGKKEADGGQQAKDEPGIGTVGVNKEG